MSRLLIKGTAKKMERFELQKGDYRVGRDAECELCLPNVSVSRVHCRLQVGDTWAAVEDVDSANGIVVNGKATKDTRLYSGDTIDVGRYQLTYLGDEPAARFLRGRCVEYLPQYVVATGRATAVGTQATYAMTKADLQRMSGARRLVDDGRLVSRADSARFWYPEDRGVSLGGSGAMIQTRGWFHWGVLAQVGWNGKRHVIYKKSRLVPVKVNGVAVDEQVLRGGDRIDLGRSGFLYEEPEDPRAARDAARRKRAETFTPGKH